MIQSVVVGLIAGVVMAGIAGAGYALRSGRSPRGLDLSAVEAVGAFVVLGAVLGTFVGVSRPFAQRSLPAATAVGIIAGVIGFAALGLVALPGRPGIATIVVLSLVGAGIGGSIGRDLFNEQEPADAGALPNGGT